MTTKRVIVDGNSLAYWRYFSRKDAPHRRTAVQWIEDFARDAQADELVIALDAPTNWRHAVFADYKAHRPQRPDGVSQELRALKEHPHAMVCEGFEADDVIASVVTKWPEARNLVIADDKDLLQLVGNNVLVSDPKRDMIWDAETVYERWGVFPHKLDMVLAVMGDKSDGIPGVPGFGEKRAAAYVNGDMVSSLQDLAEQFAHIIERNLELVRLRLDCALPDRERYQRRA